MRPKIVSQGRVDLEAMAERIAKNTTFNEDEIYGILRLWVRECNTALQRGETVKIDGLLNIAPSMKVGGKVSISNRPDRGAIANLQNPLLWTADKVNNHANLTKDTDQLLAQWDVEHPEDPVED